MADTCLHYDPLGPSEIRLVKLLPDSTATDVRCTLIKQDKYFETQVDYTAVSYCWGSGSECEITVDKSTVKVTDNLWALLSAIVQHYNMSTFYWIDALCINQQDDDERSAQVQQMWRIYSNAREVFAWLGPEHTSTNDIFRNVAERGRECKVKENGCCDKVFGVGVGIAPKLVSPELHWMNDRDYWNRAWIIQEILQARQLRLVCGPYSCNWNLFRHFLVHPKVPLTGHTEHREQSRMINLIETKASLVGKQRYTPSVLGVLQDTVTLFCSSKCSVPRDHIFAMLGHPSAVGLGIQQYVTSDYKISVDEIFLMVLEWCDVCYAQMTGPVHSNVKLVTLLLVLSLQEALGLPEDMGSTSPSVTLWVREHSDWDLSGFPNAIVTASARSINCRGPLLRHLFGAGRTAEVEQRI